jgi:serine/threonine protein phosphatase PrpC
MIVKSSSHNGIGKINEDYLICRELSDDCIIAILADGMGGLSHGDLAAHVVVNTIAQIIEKQIERLPSTDLLLDAIKQANEAIKVKSREIKCKMGAAIALLLIMDEKAYFSWLGNVRIYLKESAGIKQLTTDHIYPVDISSENKNIFLTQCISGKEFREEPPCDVINITPSSHVILCTDGFYQNLTQEKILDFGADAVQFISDNFDDFSVIELGN